MKTYKYKNYWIAGNWFHCIGQDITDKPFFVLIQAKDHLFFPQFDNIICKWKIKLKSPAEITYANLLKSL